MIAAAMGLRRDDDTAVKKLNDLHFAVRVDQTGSIYRDFQTAKKYKKTGEIERTYVTYRYYLEDSIFVAAIGHEDDAWVEKIAEALTHPYFQLFLGRRSLPVSMDFYLGEVEKDVIGAICGLEWQAVEKYRKTHDNHVTVYADADLLKENDYSMRHDQVESFSQERGRRFGSRKEAKIVIDVFCNDDHDAFGAL